METIMETSEIGSNGLYVNHMLQHILSVINDKKLWEEHYRRLIMIRKQDEDIDIKNTGGSVNITATESAADSKSSNLLITL